jgi:hypothetical protein
MSECTTSAQCTNEEYEAARAAGLLIVTTEDERAIHAFAEAIRSAHETWEGLTAKEWAQLYHALQEDALDIAKISRKVGDSYRAAYARGIAADARRAGAESPVPSGTRPEQQSTESAQTNESTAVAAQQPLTQDAKSRMYGSALMRPKQGPMTSICWYLAGVEDAERAHGIGTQAQQESGSNGK